MRLQGMTARNQTALQRRINYKTKCRKGEIDTMPVHQHVFPSSTDGLFPHHRCL
ncbi:hypothetical protein HMPREF9141_1954 [Prevotella multiformis DSM 16608]|uniref:Uncharacterized protein n=1 Tax=Prevotella multiformis DSM 16608 TaxID=888743 RepID=F0F8N7_9BACT|nr:hypothetical protein HMPREF9141_1954 [Prevotella multiformis DSM 16608]